LGTLFAYQQFEIEPDIMTLGKGLGGGVPLSALLAKDICACFEYGDQGGTFSGTALMTAAGVAVMHTLLSEDFLEGARHLGRHMAEGLELLSKEFGLGEVRGRGLLLAMELGDDIGSKVVAEARHQGLLLNAPRTHCLRFMPALNISVNEIDEGLSILRQVLKVVLK
jgi:acetylornithine/N-succinyldiaminopimelate aminotransferase